MCMIMPYSPQYCVSHLDLIKFGFDMTREAKQATGGISNSNSIESLIFAFNLPQIIFSGKSGGYIEIYKKIKLKNTLKKYKVKVDRKTGYVINPKKAFSYIAKFDPETFPKKSSESLKNVGYWNRLNKYISSV